MLLSKENIKNNVVKNTAGIYYIKNKLNNKYYIGQSINMYKRLLFHINKSKDANYQHIHRAINKDGIENFEFGILSYIIFDDKNEIKTKLDFLEKYYIKKYKCFGKDGYNATVGGDKGVLGLIQTLEVRQHISEVKLKQLHEKYNDECWCYNLDTKKYYHLNHIYEIDNLVGKEFRKSDILQYILLNKYNNLYGFIFGNSKENLQDKINYLQNYKNYTKFAHKKTDEELQKMRRSLSKYIYYQYDLNYNLIEKYYIHDILIKFSKQLVGNLKYKPINEYIQIDNNIWCKKLISDVECLNLN